MERCHRALRKVIHQRSMKEIDVKMQNVEFVRPPPDLLQHDHVIGCRVDYYWIKAESYI